MSDTRYDHNDECIGCGAHLADPCVPTCPSEQTAARKQRYTDAVMGGETTESTFDEVTRAASGGVTAVDF